MTAAHDDRSEALKEAAVLRSLAEAVASPVVAGRKSRKALTANQRLQWTTITNQVVTWPAVAQLLPENVLADLWKKQCKTAGIGTGLFGWIVWNWAFPLLLELARLWIQSRKQGQDSER
jgi:hypothetical protein